MMKGKIISTCNQEIIVDVDDIHLLSKYKWRVREGYPYTTIDGKYTRMSRFLMNPSDDEVVDHINRNTFDQSRANLRCVKRCLNSHNRERPTHRQLTSRYRGVSLNSGKWQAGYSDVRLGQYYSEEDAARAYNHFVIDKFGPEAILNDVDMSILLPPRKAKRSSNGEIRQVKDGSYRAFVTYQNVKYDVGVHVTKESAELAVTAKKQELQDDALYNTDEIARNSDGVACIKIRDQDLLCDDGTWRKHSKRKLHLSFYGYVMLGKSFLHRVITDCPSHLMVDHINRNKLDCRRQNLRCIEALENQLNRSKSKNATSRYFGVEVKDDRYVAKMRSIYILTTKCELRAAFAYNVILDEFYPECMRRNDINEENLDMSQADLVNFCTSMRENYGKRLIREQEKKKSC